MGLWDVLVFLLAQALLLIAYIDAQTVSLKQDIYIPRGFQMDF